MLGRRPSRAVVPLPENSTALATMTVPDTMIAAVAMMTVALVMTTAVDMMIVAVMTDLATTTVHDTTIAVETIAIWTVVTTDGMTDGMTDGTTVEMIAAKTDATIVMMAEGTGSAVPQGGEARTALQLHHPPHQLLPMTQRVGKIEKKPYWKTRRARSGMAD